MYPIRRENQISRLFLCRSLLQSTSNHATITRMGNLNLITDPRAQCEAITRNGVRCSRLAPEGSRYCGFHVHMNDLEPEKGRYEDAFAGELGERYRKALGDTYLLNLRDEIAVLSMRANALVAGANTGDEVGESLWRLTAATWKKLRKAIDKEDQEAIWRLAEDMDVLMKESMDTSALWKEIMEIFELRRKLSETEQKYMRESSMTVNAETVMALLAATIKSIRISVTKYVERKELAEAIIVDAQREYEKLVST